METTNNVERYYLAKTPEPQGYWGKHKDGIHHAIAQCCDAGANRFGIFVVYCGDKSMSCEPIRGGLEWNADQPEPILEGIYTAGGCYIGENLAELAESVRKGLTEPEEWALDRKVVEALKAHKPQD